MTVMFWMLYVPVVSLLFLVSYVVIRICERLRRVEEEFLIFEEADDAKFMAELAEFGQHADRRLAELKALTQMQVKPTPRRMH